MIQLDRAIANYYRLSKVTMSLSAEVCGENLHNFTVAVFGRPLGPALGTICRLSVVCLFVTHVLWLNGTS